MGAAPENAGGRVLVEQNYMWDEHNGERIQMGDAGKGLGSTKEESRVGDAAEDVNNVGERAIHVHDGQPQQQQSRGPIVWERFLPTRSLKVLLVENDDSTRHVVSALLRNCSYEVTAVANGVQAWKVLENLSNHIDLILTEVVMPFLTGVGLLCKIMSHKTLKNIPVIMMSSHDSMGIVFKCLSKGAVDFLVKPIRKNELKNLWQHVWRRCHSSSGSGSESGTHTKKSIKSKNIEESGNNCGSSDEHDDESTGVNIRDGSDNGSGTQSSWTKKAVDMDSPQPSTPPLDQSADAPDSTCAQAIHTKPEALSDSWVHVSKKKDCQEQDGKSGTGVVRKVLEIGLPIRAGVPVECQSERLLTHLRSKQQNKLPGLEKEPYQEHIRDISETGEENEPVVHLMNTNMNYAATPGPLKVTEAPTGLTFNSLESESLELSLRRLRGEVNVETATHDQRSILRRSDSSAFSKYNNASSSNQAPTGNVGSCSPAGNGSNVMKTEIVHTYASNCYDGPANLHFSGSRNNNDMASTTKHSTPKPEVLNGNSKFSALGYFQASPSQAVEDGRMCESMQELPDKEDDLSEEESRSHQNVQVQHHHHHYHHYHHHVHSMQQQKKKSQLDHDDCSLKMETAAPQCGSSNVFGGPIEGNAGNYSVNASASGSNHGSNGQNGSTALNGLANMESDNGIAGNSGTGGSSCRISGSGDEDRIAQREAALTKFRQKRKERCFEKKVRYQSRKRLAEQRPRVRGQFVRQTLCDSKTENDEQSSSLVSEDNSCDG